MSTMAWALIAIAPGAVASALHPGTWTIFATAGAILGACGLVVRGLSGAANLAAVEQRERQLQAGMATAEARVSVLEAKARESASQDEVTGTLNRRAFLLRLDETIRRDARMKKPMAFVLVDIDGFKKINADAGRMIGDRVLQRVARAIQGATRGTDFVGRIGGDEFAVVLGECHDPRPAVDRVVVALHGESTGGDQGLPIQVSFGAVTVGGGGREVDAVKLFRVAEEALASVRGTGGRCGSRAYPVESPSSRQPTPIG